MSWCQNCGQVDVILPVEPLYEPEVAASLVPCTRASLFNLLQKHKAELPAPHYRIWRRHRYRLISVTEIKWARERLIRRRAKWTPDRAEAHRKEWRERGKATSTGEAAPSRSVDSA